MAIRTLIQLTAPIIGIDGEEYAYLAGEFDGDEQHVLATTPYGNLAIPRGNIAFMFALGEDVAFPASEYVWRIN